MNDTRNKAVKKRREEIVGQKRKCLRSIVLTTHTLSALDLASSARCDVSIVPYKAACPIFEVGRWGRRKRVPDNMDKLSFTNELTILWFCPV